MDCVNLVIEAMDHHANARKPKAFLHVVDFLTTLVIRLRKVDYGTYNYNTIDCIDLTRNLHADQAKNAELMRRLVETKTLNSFTEEAQKLLDEHQFKYMEAILRFMFMIASGGTSSKLAILYKAITYLYP